MTSAAERLRVDRLVDEACTAAGSDDFGADDGWRDGLARVVDAMIHEARLSPLGVEFGASELVLAMRNRLYVSSWRAEHPEVAQEKVERPIFIVGQPRTGTTILYDMLAQDPQLRSPLTWEVDNPYPAPTAATYRSDPRIEQTQSQYDMVESMMPGFQKIHPMGALLGQECVRIWTGQFRSMVYSSSYRIPSYYRWLLYEPDYALAYRYHRRYLQHLQSGVSGRWLLKSPAHIWSLDALFGEYPDAFIVQTHRDPLKVLASVSATIHHLRKIGSDESTLVDVAEQWHEEIGVGLKREMHFRDEGAVPVDRIFDVRFVDFIADPFGVVRQIYDRLDLELRPEVEKRMREFLRANPKENAGAWYSWHDTGLDFDTVRHEVAEYQERYDVPSEPLR